MKNRIEKIVEENKDRIAYIIDTKVITYGELWDCSLEKAEFLRKQGSEPVILYGHKSIEMVISILACIIADRTYIPVDLCTPVSRINKIIDMTNASLLIKIENLNSYDLKIETCSFDGLSLYEDREILTYENDTVYIIFTSGSTGDPKGVPISKENLKNFIDWISNLRPLDGYRNVNVLNQASFSFDLSVADFYYALCNGHTLVGLSRDLQDNYQDIFRVLKNNNISVAVMTPTFMKLCLLNSDFTSINFPFLKCVYFCGEKLEVKLVKKLFSVFPDISIINAYGPTEATSAVSGIVITKEMTDVADLLPVGEIDNFATEIIIDNDEIVLKGKSVFSGYLGNVVGGFYIENGINCYRTGDFGFIRDGKLYCKSRMDSQVKYKGYRIELSDIESNLNSIPGVSESAVIAKYNSEGIVRLIKAFVVLEDSAEIETIKLQLKKLIPGYMIPNQIKVMEKLPLNCNNKIDRKLLSEL